MHYADKLIKSKALYTVKPNDGHKKWQCLECSGSIPCQIIQKTKPRDCSIMGQKAKWKAK